MSHTANTAHTEPTTRRAARRGAVEDVVVTEDGLVLNDPTHLELPGHGNSPGAWAMVALVLVGFLMMQQIVRVDWSDVEIAIPAFMTVVLMPFSYSITNGIGAGFITYVLIKVLRGKLREVHPLMYVTAALFVLYFVSGPIQDALGVS